MGRMRLVVQILVLANTCLSFKTTNAPRSEYGAHRANRHVEHMYIRIYRRTDIVIFIKRVKRL